MDLIWGQGVKWRSSAGFPRMDALLSKRRDCTQSREQETSHPC